MRLRPDSCAAWLKLVKVRSFANGVSDFSVKVMLSVPKKPASTAAPAALNVLCPDVYDGNGGVGISGVQSLSATVSGLPSVSAARMAVTGRQKLYSYFASQATRTASARAMLSRANSRAFSARLRPRAADTSCATMFQCPGGVAVPGPLIQNRAISVCSAVRVVLSMAPSSLTWLKAAVYSALVRAGGGGGRNCEPLFKANGSTSGQPGRTAEAKSGGVGCQSPGSLPGVYVTTSAEPS